MPAACTKADLLARTDTDFAKLERVLDGVPEDKACTAGPDGISIKDIVGHRAHWIGLFLRWRADGLAGRPVHMPDEGVGWNQLPAYNESIRKAQADLDWHGARDLLRARHAELREAIEASSQGQLYGAPMPGHARWTTGRFAEASGASHYRSAVRAIRTMLKTLA